MKLLFSPTSPYSRKARIVLREKALLGRVGETAAMPADRPPELLAANPLGKVPALVLDGGEALYDSPVICEYLDSLAPGSALVPAGQARWPVLRTQALADGIMDVAVVWLMERRRPAGQQSAAAMDHNRGQIVAAVGEAAGQLQALEGELTLGHIALACALGYLEFRHPDFAWREHADSRLVDWCAGFGERASLRETAHPA